MSCRSDYPPIPGGLKGITRDLSFGVGAGTLGVVCGVLERVTCGQRRDSPDSLTILAETLPRPRTNAILAVPVLLRSRPHIGRVFARICTVDFSS